MPVIKVIECVGSSESSWEDAARTAVSEAARTVRNIRGVEVLNWTAHVDDQGGITHYRANVNISFLVEGR